MLISADQITGLNHLGVAVASIAEARVFYESVLGAAYEGEELVVDQGVRTAFLRIGEGAAAVRIELLEATNEDSPIAKFLSKRGPGLHHVAYTVDDLKSALENAKQAGVRLIDTTPRRGAHGQDIAFLHPQSTGGLLTELCRPSTPPAATDGELDLEFNNRALETVSSELGGSIRAGRVAPVDFTLLESFDRCVARQADAPAVIAGPRTVTFQELRELSLRAAAGLNAAGVRSGDLVGVHCRRSPDLVAVILGIWRCGAVYVPLDPKYPSKRLEAIIEAVGLKLIVGDDQPPRHGRAEIEFQRTSGLLDAPPTSPGKLASAALSDRAVVLYTSGSTGVPKGAVLTHRNLANHQAYVIREYGLGPHDRRPAVCSINFDASLEELFCTLNSGATLMLPDERTLESFERLLRFIEQHRITTLFLPTSLWRELTNYLYDSRQEFPTTLRLINVGGERATRPIYERFLKVGGRRMRWINVYGPTECSIYATIYEHRPDIDAAAGDELPIGRPLDNVELFVLDPTGRPVPFGEAGELYIGGTGVGEGYLGLDSMTRERFVDRPSAELSSGRYYRTGDEVRFRADGELMFVGRLDDQIKLRGFRIEPGEIETMLLRHPAVRDAAVVVRTSTIDTNFLAAYVVLRPGASWDERSLSEFARERLPEYMVPQAFVQLEALPLSPNGKVARSLLPEPFPASRIVADTESERSDRPMTPLEQRIWEVWRETLCLDELDVNDDFFAMGGDSLRVMALVAKLEAELDRPIPASTLFAAPTVAQFAAALENDEGHYGEPIVLLRDGDRCRPLVLIHSLAGDVWIYRELVRNLSTDRAVYGLQLPRQVGAEIDDIEVYAAGCVERLRKLQPTGPYHLAGYSSGGMIAYELARQLAAADEEVAFLGLIDAGVPPALEQQLTASPFVRLRSLIRNFPYYAKELRSESLSKLRRRILRSIGPRLSGWVSRRYRSERPTERNDREWMNLFAEDISFFPELRLEQIKQHCRAVFRYVPKSYAGSAQLFRIGRQPLSAVPTPTLGWEHVITGPIDVHDVDGTHDGLLRMPYVEPLTAAFNAASAGLPQRALQST